jgi:predicted nucleic acid-binding Zn ribbon protein
MSSRQPQAISEIIKDFFEGGIKGERVADRMHRAQDIDRLWRKAVGKKIARHTQAVSLRRERLVVNVDNPGWAYELSLKKKSLLNTLNRQAKECRVCEIQFRLGKL